MVASGCQYSREFLFFIFLWNSPHFPLQAFVIRKTKAMNKEYLFPSPSGPSGSLCCLRLLWFLPLLNTGSDSWVQIRVYSLFRYLCQLCKLLQEKEHISFYSTLPHHSLCLQELLLRNCLACFHPWPSYSLFHLPAPPPPWSPRDSLWAS